MPSWGAILREIQDSAARRGAQGPDIDGIRLKYIQQLQGHSKRAVIVYASGWLRSGGREDLDYSVEGNDVHTLMEVCHKRAGRLDAPSYMPMLAGCWNSVASRSSCPRRSSPAG